MTADVGTTVISVMPKDLLAATKLAAPSATSASASSAGAADEAENKFVATLRYAEVLRIFYIVSFFGVVDFHFSFHFHFHFCQSCQGEEKRISVSLRSTEGEFGDLDITVVAACKPKAAKVLILSFKCNFWSKSSRSHANLFNVWVETAVLSHSYSPLISSLQASHGLPRGLRAASKQSEI
jgi:hypothetical protein